MADQYAGISAFVDPVGRTLFPRGEPGQPLDETATPRFKRHPETDKRLRRGKQQG